MTEVTVSGRRSGPLSAGEVITSTNLLTVPEQVESQTVSDPLQLLKRVPGVYMQDYNQGTISTGLGMRGFDTQNEGPAVKLLIDGIPSNFHAIGMPDLKVSFPLKIDHVEVVQGTNDPRYGVNNVAGNVNVVTREERERPRGTRSGRQLWHDRTAAALRVPNRSLQAYVFPRLPRLGRFSRQRADGSVRGCASPSSSTSPTSG